MIKRIISIAVITTMMVSAAAVLSYGEEAKVSSKVETVYGILDNTGAVDEIYVVNEFEIEKAGLLIDFGDYHLATNLTGIEDITIKEDEVSVSPSEGLFYYQGDLNIKELPWNFDIEYTLDGEEILPDMLAGKDGVLDIKIKGEKNVSITEDYHDKYLLQVTVTLNSENADNVEAEAGTLTSVGSYKIITFAGIPGEDLECELSAVVNDFEMKGITINAVPLSIDKDMLDMEEFEQGLLDLTEGVAELNDGAIALAEGSGEISEGITELYQGSDEFYKGLLAIEGAGYTLEAGSTQILAGLSAMNSQLADVSNDDLINGLNDMKTGLNTLSDSLDSVRLGLIGADQTLAAAIGNIPDETLTNEEIGQILANNPGDANVQLLINYYAAGVEVKQTYAGLSSNYQVMFQNLDDICTGITDIADSIDLMVEGLNDTGFSELVAGFNQITTQYAAFDTGLKDYLDGISDATLGYEEFDGGIDLFGKEYGAFHYGIKGLSDGITELKEGTDSIPTEIDALIERFNNSDYSPVSYASKENGEIDAVQFLITTTGIEKEEEPEVDYGEEKNLTFWDRLINLFIRD